MAQLPGSSPNRQDIIGMVSLRTEFDISEADASYDTKLLEYLRRACSWVSQQLGGNVLDGAISVMARPEDLTAPIRLRRRWAKSLDSMEYWTPDSPSEAAEPDGVIHAASCRFDYRRARQGGTLYLHPPAPGYRWPDRLPDTWFRLGLTTGLDMSYPEAEAVRDMVMLAVAQRQEKIEDIRPTNAFIRLHDALTRLYG